MVLDLLNKLGGWSWVIIGLILLGLELVAPGNVFVWFGLAAMLTGAFALLTDFGWQVDGLVFVVLAVVLVVVGRRYFAWRGRGSEQPLLNQRAARLIGQAHLLAEPILDGNGRLRIDDTIWRVTGPDLPAGTRVLVAGHDGSILRVERAAD